jgi:radical SAM protein with 4Fe4S-binding SPASM domain
MVDAVKQKYFTTGETSIPSEDIHFLGFPDEKIDECLKNKGLLSIELEFTKKCNLRCIYCYSDAGSALNNELSLEELKSVICQAKELGAEKIILLGGGEPLIYKGLREIITYISSLGLKQVLFTNGTLISDSIASILYNYEVSVIVKYNSNDTSIQDYLAGVRGTRKRIIQGLECLMNAGYPDKKRALGIQSIICQVNIKELPHLWKWARICGIIPYFEMLTLQGRAKMHKELSVSPDEVRSLFEELETIDNSFFGITWKARPTIAAFACKRHLYSCLINSQGLVQPCTGVDLSIGNIRNHHLKHILSCSPVIQKLRNIYNEIKGTCRTCSFNGECYGCRGTAYQCTGDYLASDHTCWLANQ